MKEVTTNRNHLMAMLDENPSDQVTRAILADLIEENPLYRTDVWLSKGLRWMVANDKYPYKHRWRFHTAWVWLFGPTFGVAECHIIPFHMAELYFLTRLDAEVRLAEALRGKI